MHLRTSVAVIALASACAHLTEPATSAPRRTQAPHFIHRRTFVEQGFKPATNCGELCQRYAAATASAKYPTAQGITTGLDALLPSTSGLVWKDGKILMGTWTELKYYGNLQPGQSFKLDGDTWWTAVPVMKRWCQSLNPHLSGDALRVRIAQRLGMPPNAPDDGFVQVWVDPNTIFRPCPDPEIQDRECMVEISMVPPFQRQANQPPWACSGVQTNASFVDVQPSHLQWMCTNWTGSYDNSNPLENYPWTALGWTYDWGQADHFGPSEFVSLDQTEVVFESGTPTDTYCNALVQ